MSRGSIGGRVGSAINGFILLIIGIILVVLFFAIESAAENPVWDTAGQVFGQTVGGWAQAAWSALGVVGTIVGFILLAAVVIGMVSRYGRSLR